MKKKLLLPAMLVTVMASAQTPPNVSMPIVQKATATWCGPCGDWGWTLMDEIRQDNSAKAFVFSCYGSSTSNYYNQAAYDLTDWGQSWPNWAVNNKNRTVFSGTSIIPTSTRTTIKNVVDSFAATAPTASTGFTYSISGNNVTVNTSTKFWKAASGEYYLAAYLVEDSVFGIQNGKTGSVYHHDVLRGSMTAASTYGVLLASGSIPINQMYSKTFNFTITDATWVKSRLKVLTVIWKKNGTTYDFVNANSKKSSGAAVSALEAVEDMEVYPNPATSLVNVSGTLKWPGDIQIRMVNPLGQVVYSKTLHTENNRLSERIATENLAPGIYMLNVSAREMRSTRGVFISK